MARKEPQKRPSEAQLLKSQKRIAGYIAGSGQPFKKAAADLGYTAREIKKFFYDDPAKTIANYNRNITTRGLFRLSTNVVEKRVEIKSGPSKGLLVPQKVRAFTGPIKGVTPVSDKEGTEEQQRLYKRFVQSIKLQQETPTLSMSMAWKEYTSGKGLPTSIEEIKEMYANDEISKREVTSILTHWRNIYPTMSDEWYSDMADQFAEYDELRDIA